MTTTPATLIKTKAEIALAEEFERVLPGLPGNDAVRAARRASMAKFAAVGLPHRRLEEWKYTDLRALVKDTSPAGGSVAATVADPLGVVDALTYVFIDGRFVDAPAGGGVAGITVETLAPSLDAAAVVLPMPAMVDVGAGSIASLNGAFVSDGAIVRIANGAKPDKPVHLLFVSTGRSSVRNRIVVGAGATATVIESHLSAPGATRQENVVSSVDIGAGAVLHYAVTTRTETGSLHLGHAVATLAENAIFKPFQLSTGDGLARQQVTVTFEGGHASFDFAAVTLARAAGHSDTTVTVRHVAPNCTSRELFKTVLDGNARAIFQGKVIVEKDAQKTDGKQMARALLLSPTTEFDSKPELEIYADDVACGHGSTCAEIDPDLVFYCMSRGIPEAQARALLIESFVGEAIEKVDNPALRQALTRIANAWLGGAPA